MTLSTLSLLMVAVSSPLAQRTAVDRGLATQTIGGAEVVISNAGAAIGGHVTDAASHR